MQIKKLGKKRRALLSVRPSTGSLALAQTRQVVPSPPLAVSRGGLSPAQNLRHHQYETDEYETDQPQIASQPQRQRVTPPLATPAGHTNGVTATRLQLPLRRDPATPSGSRETPHQTARVNNRANVEQEQGSPSYRGPAMSSAPSPVRPLYPETVAQLGSTYQKSGTHTVNTVRRKRTKRTFAAKKVLITASSVCMVAILLVSGYFVWQGYGTMRKVFRGNETVAALTTRNVDPRLLKGEGSGRVNVLMLGIDGGGKLGSDMTDSMVILSVDPVNNTAAFVNIPHDLWVKMPVNYNAANQKISAAYSNGKYKAAGKIDTTNSNQDAVNAGFAAVDQSVKEVTGLTINYHVLVDYKAFQQAIDTIGGVDVTVMEPVIDPTMAWENGGNPTLVSAGNQHMDSYRALLYARSAATTSDHSRAERQRTLVLALKDALLTPDAYSSPAKIQGLLDAFGDNVVTDFTPQAALRLATILHTIRNDEITSLNLTQAPHDIVIADKAKEGYKEVPMIRPKVGLYNYAEIHAFIRTQLQDGYLLKEDAPIHVITETDSFGENLVVSLQSQGYTLIGHTQASGVKLPSTSIIDLSRGGKPYTKRYLESRYGVKVATSLPKELAQSVPAGAQFVILVNR